MTITQTCRTPVAASDPSSPDHIAYSSQRKNGKFSFNGDAMNISPGHFIGSIRDFLFGGAEMTPKVPLPVQPVDPAHFLTTEPDRLNVTWLGHSSLMLHIDGCKLLLDPVFSKRLTPLGPSRFNSEVPLAIDRVPDIDLVIISHDHYDHLSKPTILGLRDRVARFAVPLAVGARLRKWGIPAERIAELDWWESLRFGPNLRIVATPAQHFSGRALMDRNKTLWASWVISGNTHRVFFSGDSGYFDGFTQIGDTYGPFDLTLLECGAYHEAWHGMHMFPEETVRAHLDLGGGLLHPIHWGTFKLSTHSWYDPMQRLTATATAHGIRTATPIVGGTTDLDSGIPNTRWWEPYINTIKR